MTRPGTGKTESRLQLSPKFVEEFAANLIDIIKKLKLCSKM